MVVINYDLRKAFRDQLRATVWSLLVADECHYLDRAQRTREVIGSEGIAPKAAERRALMTGTPIANRPAEL